jgi:hypothetical protein
VGQDAVDVLMVETPEASIVIDDISFWFF